MTENLTLPSGTGSGAKAPLPSVVDPVIETVTELRFARKRRARRNRVAAVIVLALSALALAVGLLMTVGPHITHLAYDELRVNAFHASSGASGEPAQTANSSSEPDWDTLATENPDTVGWVSVDNTPVSYPLAKGWDNDYYLTHDFWGNWDWNGCPFTDYRSDPNGRHALCYGHNMYGGTMFGPLRDSFNQSHFDTLGVCRWSTPELGETELTPLCATYVDKWYEPIQTFDFTPTDDEVQSRVDTIVASHELDLNRLDAPASLDDLVRDRAETFSATDDDYATARCDAEDTRFHAWLETVLAESDARAWNADELSSTASRAVTLVTCNSPYGGAPTRTIIVFVA